MKIYFYLRYHTKFGQSLFVTGNCETLGNNMAGKQVQMTYLDNDHWMAEVHWEKDETPVLRYRYMLQNTDGSFLRDGDPDRELDASKITANEIRVSDVWNFNGAFQNVFYTDPFQQVLLPRLPASVLKTRPWRGNTHVFRVKAPLLKKDEVLCISGGCSQMGNWNTENPVIMHKEGNWWTIKFNFSGVEFPIPYKYGIYHNKQKTFLRFEDGDNRLVQEAPKKGRLHILHDGFLHLPSEHWKGTGVSVPVFSLRSGNGYGVGEFPDLKLMADWAHRTGMKMIQILPVNDTTATHTWLDSYPYSAVSAFALNPVYLNLDKVLSPENTGLIKKWKKTKKALNDLPDLDYDQVMNFKNQAMRELYELEKQAGLLSESYQTFFQTNEHWLVPYAAFCFLRDKYKTADFSKWKTHARYEEKNIRKLTAANGKHYDQIRFYYFIQYHLHLQLEDAVQYAHGKGVILKGDIPIGIYRHSVDAWQRPELYNMNEQAGAPPDDFAIKGQNWGFPTYNWQKMEEDGFSWWKQRFGQMSHYFDAFRIDHILGFFRIWSIPSHAVEGIMGRFDPAVPVYLNEFQERGVHFEKDRFCKPFINDAIIWELFNAEADHIKETFLLHTAPDTWELRPEFDTQRKVEAWFAHLEAGDQQHKFKQGLFDLIANVLLFPDAKEEDGFHFRFHIQNTISYRELDPHSRHQVDELYKDYFFRRQDGFWKNEALRKLPVLKDSTNMLICGEDLGMVPDCVPDVMRELGILSLEIQRMPKTKDKEVKFFHPSQAPYLSVITPATHDMSTVRGWWEEDRALTQRFYNEMLGQWGNAPYFCEAWINKAILLQHLYSPAIWCVFQIQDFLGIDERLRREDPKEERINVPANAKNYWRYRMHVTLEELMRQKTFTEEIQTYIRQSGRA